MKNILFLIIVSLCLLSCGPSVNPQLKAKLNKYPVSKSSANFGASQKITSAMKYVKGQYVVYKNTDSDGKKSISKTTVIGKEGKGWIFEFYSLSESQEGIVQMLISGIEKAATPDSIEIQWIKTKDEKGQVQKIEGSMLKIMKSVYESYTTNMAVNYSVTEKGGTVKVPAGVFSGTYKIKTEASVMGKTYKSTAWIHSKVPVNRIVKSIADDNSLIMELISFGTNGKSQF